MSGVAFPVVSTELLSDSVLVESWAPGAPIADILTRRAAWSDPCPREAEGRCEPDHPSTTLVSSADSISSPGLLSPAARRELADTVFDMNIKMFLRDNFVHGDLHAGNLLYDMASVCFYCCRIFRPYNPVVVHVREL